jgi:hypothetical protein
MPGASYFEICRLQLEKHRLSLAPRRVDEWLKVALHVICLEVFAAIDTNMSTVNWLPGNIKLPIDVLGTLKRLIRCCPWGISSTAFLSKVPMAIFALFTPSCKLRML